MGREEDAGSCKKNEKKWSKWLDTLGSSELQSCPFPDDALMAMGHGHGHGHESIKKDLCGFCCPLML